MIDTGLGIILSVPMENATSDGVEASILRMSHGEMQGDDAVATTLRGVITLIITRSGIGLPVPDIAVPAFVVVEFIGDLVGYR